jgi:hypothetical protein
VGPLDKHTDDLFPGQALVYSVKLKLEFRILNQLTDIAQERLRSSNAAFSDPSQTLGSGGMSPLTTGEDPNGHWGARQQSLVSPLDSITTHGQRLEEKRLSESIPNPPARTFDLRRTSDDHDAGFERRLGEK